MADDPFSAWLRLWSVSAEMATTGLRAAEMLAASAFVVARRSALIDQATRTPLDADVAELSRMVPEKVDAFTRAALPLVSVWWKGQAAALGEFQRLARAQQSMALRTIEQGSRTGAAALAPVHRRATGNARRLSRKKG